LYLSRMILNPDNREVMRGFARPSVFHGAIETATHRGSGRNLWRIDAFQKGYCLLILTTEAPDLTSMQGQFGFPGQSPLTKEYDHFLQKIEQGQQWQFRIKINPVVNHLGDRIPVKNCDLNEWFIEKAEKNGFSVNESAFSLIELRDYSFTKNNIKEAVQFKTATFNGTLVISDKEKILLALQNGIGHEKAFGCGLLTLARINEERIVERDLQC